MGMQITSLGNTFAVPAPQEKADSGPKVPMLGEQKAAEQAEFSIPGPGSGKAKTQEIKQTTRDLEQISLAFDRRLKFVIDQESREILIKVIDNETDKVIKVLPPEELQRLHSRIRETIGFLFDQRV